MAHNERARDLVVVSIYMFLNSHALLVAFWDMLTLLTDVAPARLFMDHVYPSQCNTQPILAMTRTCQWAMCTYNL